MKTGIALTLLLLTCKTDIAPEISPYPGGMEKSAYLTGKYDPKKYLVEYTNPLEKNTFYLRKDTADALDKMLADFAAETGIPVKQHIFVSSAFRSYTHQKAIWEDKFRGRRKMRESVAGKSPEQIVKLILEYSSAPGTSRHHWGTDFDINVLTNDYYRTGGRGEYIYKWLSANARKYGFCQPYNEYEKRNNKGYNEERWHWSYRPAAKILQRDWNSLLDSGEINFNGAFSGSDLLGSRPRDYVNSVNRECL